MYDRSLGIVTVSGMRMISLYRSFHMLLVRRHWWTWLLACAAFALVYGIKALSDRPFEVYGIAIPGWVDGLSFGIFIAYLVLMMTQRLDLASAYQLQHRDPAKPNYPVTLSVERKGKAFAVEAGVCHFDKGVLVYTSPTRQASFGRGDILEAHVKPDTDVLEAIPEEGARACFRGIEKWTARDTADQTQAFRAAALKWIDAPAVHAASPVLPLPQIRPFLQELGSLVASFAFTLFLFALPVLIYLAISSLL